MLLHVPRLIYIKNKYSNKINWDSCHHFLHNVADSIKHGIHVVMSSLWLLLPFQFSPWWSWTVIVFSKRAQNHYTPNPVNVIFNWNWKFIPTNTFLMLCWFTRLVSYGVFGTKQQRYQILLLINSFTTIIFNNWNEQDQSVSTKSHFSVK